MLSYLRTSILDSNAQTVVNTVNTVGVMGKGLAEAYKKRYPGMFESYKKLCAERKFNIGQLWLWKSSAQWVLNFPTKKHWRNPSKIEYIEAGLKKFAAEYERRSIFEISFPRLGCGNGGLDWDDVRPIMDSYLSKLPIQIYIHDYVVDLKWREHETNASFDWRYESFLADMRKVVSDNKGAFFTIIDDQSFQAFFNDHGDLSIESGDVRNLISQEEIHQIWTLMLRAPLTEDRLAGPPLHNSKYIFPIVAQLPYARLVEIERKGGPELAIEIIDQAQERTVLGMGSSTSQQSLGI